MLNTCFISIWQVFSSASVDVLGDADVFERLLDEFQELLVALDLQGHSDLAGCLGHKAVE